KPSATAADIYSAIKGSAKPIGSSVAFGRVNAAGTLFALGAAPTSTSTSATSSATSTASQKLTGTLTRARQLVSFRRSVGAGALSLRLTFDGAKTLTLRLVDSAGHTVLRRASGSPVRLGKTVAPGVY